MTCHTAGTVFSCPECRNSRIRALPGTPAEPHTQHPLNSTRIKSGRCRLDSTESNANAQQNSAFATGAEASPQLLDIIHRLVSMAFPSQMRNVAIGNPIPPTIHTTATAAIMASTTQSAHFVSSKFIAITKRASLVRVRRVSGFMLGQKCCGVYHVTTENNSVADDLPRKGISAQAKLSRGDAGWLIRLTNFFPVRQISTQLPVQAPPTTLTISSSHRAAAPTLDNAPRR